jgi:hypothetical protein
MKNFSKSPAINRLMFFNLFPGEEKREAFERPHNLVSGWWNL